MAAYYNEIDPYCAEWLRNLIRAGHIAHGDVDTRSIVDVHADDLKGYTQCHFFAGIGGWSLALRLARWPDERPVWTGSCPCQPFSVAGKGQAANDERHLAPAWLSLIAESRPPVVFGEQVEAAIGWGWLDFVFDALEAQGYACGAAVLPACGVGAPHIRQRLYFVADSERRARQLDRCELADEARAAEGAAPERQRLRPESRHGREPCAVAHRQSDGRGQGRANPPRRAQGTGSQGAGGGPADDGSSELAHADGRYASTEGIQRSGEHGLVAQDGCSGVALGDTIEPRLEGHAGDGDDRDQPGWLGADEARSVATTSGDDGMGDTAREQVGRAAQPRENFWRDCIWLPCIDGKARPTKPGIFPLAHGVPARMGKLRAAGNAIIPQVAEAFIRAYDMRDV